MTPTLLESMMDWIAGFAKDMTSHERMALAARFRKPQMLPLESDRVGFTLPFQTYTALEDGAIEEYEDRGAQLVIEPSPYRLTIALDSKGLAQDGMVGGMPTVSFERYEGGFRLYIHGRSDARGNARIEISDSGRITALNDSNCYAVETCLSESEESQE